MMKLTNKKCTIRKSTNNAILNNMMKSEKNVV